MTTIEKLRKLGTGDLHATGAYHYVTGEVRVFHSECIHNEGLPAAPGWYWEWRESGEWHGPHDTQEAAAADARQHDLTGMWP